MAGIYIHIPFCAKACHYCNFHFSTSLHHKPKVISAIAAHIAQGIVPNGVRMQRNIDTIYFGGGTPSLLSQNEFELLFAAIHARFDIAPDAEITLEANPDNINAANLAVWQKNGINRLSIGIQSFRQQDLEWMNRAHTASQSISSLQLVKNSGITNFSIDMIYGLPVADDAAWQENLLQAIALTPPHISAYALTVEEHTALHYFIKKGKADAPKEERQHAQFECLRSMLMQSGYHHYEISNFSKPGKESRHNSSYWGGNAYYGFGPGAHSFDGNFKRWWFVPNNALFVTHATEPALLITQEELSPTDRINEMIMTGLRQDKGVGYDAVNGTIGAIQMAEKQLQAFEKSLRRLISEQLIFHDNKRIKLTERGLFLADGIAAALFLDA